MDSSQSVAINLFLTRVRNGVWFVGIPSWIFGVTDRSIAAFADGYVTTIELFHLLTASLFFLSWLWLKPEEKWNSGGIDAIQRYQSDLTLHQSQTGLSTAQNRIAELQDYHMITQEYTLPFPYLCQIYHLLNLKHLETIHSVSLGNLKIIGVSQFEATTIGGRIKFQTVLDSPFNALRIWRQPVVEVDLTLHSPYTVELSIPVYNDKRIIVIFTAIPLNQNEHKLFIDIYSNLRWPKPLLQLLLHVAACLTLFEDLPYLQQLAERNIHRLFRMNRSSNHETMQLFRRFVDLYGGLGTDGVQSRRAIESSPA